MINVDYSSLVDHAGEPPSLVAGVIALACWTALGMWLYRRFVGPRLTQGAHHAGNPYQRYP